MYDSQYGFRKEHPMEFATLEYIDRVDEFNFLGISFNEQLNWQSHIKQISNRCYRIIGILNKLK